MADRQLSESFVSALLECQDRLHAYIVALGVSSEDVGDVLQNTNVVLCREADQWPTIKSFTAWACRIAYFEVLSARKRRSRESLRFDADLLELIAEETPSYVEKLGAYQTLLNQCLAELPDGQREMLLERYSRSGSIQRLAERLGRSAASIHQTLYRIRATVMRCVQLKMRDEP
jgi:RNA polymerase sigma-70 factor (ECF subfamily)